jgi:hypothetical protein
MNSTSNIQHPFFTKMATNTKTTNKSKTYGRGKLRINLNSPRGNIGVIWAIAMNLMEQLKWNKQKTEETLKSLEADDYEKCLEAFGNHKVFGNLFQLYYSPKYKLGWDEGEWGRPDEDYEEDSEEE